MPFDAPCQTPLGDIKLLTDARSRIRNRNSWVQGRFQDMDRYCLVAALSLACGSRSFDIPNRTEKKLARLIAAQIPRDAPFMSRWRLVPVRQRLMALNDAPCTTHEDVMALFDRTINHLATTARISAPA